MALVTGPNVEDEELHEFQAMENEESNSNSLGA